MLIPYKESMRVKKNSIIHSDFINWVWEKAIFFQKKHKGFKFHHEISTDGVAASVLLSRPTKSHTARGPKKRRVCLSFFSCGS